MYGSSAPSPDEWNAMVLRCQVPSLLQTHQWGELKSRFGWEPLRLEDVAGLAQVLLRSTPVGRIAYVPRGPALAGELGRSLTDLLPTLHSACRKAGAFALKLEPNVRDGADSAATLGVLGFRPSTQTVQPRSTVLVELDGSEDSLLARMKPKTRYNLRLSAKKGVAVHVGTAADLPAFAALMQETSRRDGFAVHSAAYYSAALELFEPLGMARLLLAEYEGDLLAGLMAFAFGDTAYYFYGASSGRQRNLMPTYGLQWEAMRWARGLGCRVYDLWGIPDEVGRDPGAHMDDEVTAREGLWGVWRFKRGFGGRVVRYLGAWDYVYHPAAFLLYGGLLRLRRAVGGLAAS